MASVLRQLPGSASGELWSAAMNSLASASGAVSAEYDNSGSTERWVEGELVINQTLGGTPTGGLTIEVFMMVAPDGTNYQTVNANGTPYELYSTRIGAFVVGAVAANRLVLPVRMLPYKTKFLIVNRTGQTFQASGGSLKFYPRTTEVASA